MDYDGDEIIFRDWARPAGLDAKVAGELQGWAGLEDVW